MKDATMKACIAIPSVVAVYAIYMIWGPDGNGALLATVLGIVGALAGYTFGALKKDV